MVRFALAVATSAGVGYIPFAPGTFGSLVGLAIWWWLPASIPVQLVLALVLFIVGAWSATVAERHFARTDPGQVVVDEVLGMGITLLFTPLTWVTAILGFLLFRMFDIIKPYPTNRLEHLFGGVGVMADDVMAGVYANVVLQIVLALSRAAGWNQ